MKDKHTGLTKVIQGQELKSKEKARQREAQELKLREQLKQRDEQLMQKDQQLKQREELLKQKDEIHKLLQREQEEQRVALAKVELREWSPCAPEREDS